MGDEGDVMSASQSTGSEHLGVLQEWLGIHWWISREFSLLVVLIVMLLPLILLKRVESLKFSSDVSFLLAVVFVAINSVMEIYAIIQGKAKSPMLVPDLHNGDAFSLFTAVPVIVTAFTLSQQSTLSIFCLFFDVHATHFQHFGIGDINRLLSESYYDIHFSDLLLVRGSSCFGCFSAHAGRSISASPKISFRVMFLSWK